MFTNNFKYYCHSFWGTPFYQYSINGGGNQLTNTFNGYGAGTYTITVTDFNNCTATTIITLSAPPTLNVTANFTPITTCNGTTTIVTTVSGGASPYQYQLNGGPLQGSNTFLNVSSGTYTISVTDANNCTGSTTVFIAAANPINVTAAAPAILCNNGTTTIIASGTGGTAPYQFQLNTNPFQVGNSFSLISAGTYTITAQDANNCTASTVITIANPPAVTVAASAPAILCYNGTTTITASGSGGAAPYQYQLNTNPFQVGNSFNPISAGTYTITVQDANNCTASTVITITQPPVLVIDSIINTIPSCVPGNDAVITVFASGGTPPLQYSNGGPFQNSNIFLNVGAGAYTITVMDANNCSVSSAILIAPPNAPQWQNLSVVEPLCFAGNTGSISISAIGANPPLNYTLMPGNVNNATGLFPNLIAGSYTVTVADANNCSISTVILINQPTQLNVTAAAPAILCNNGTTTIIASGTGGTAPYQFQLNTNPFQVGNSFSLISAGTYTITAQDANNCTASTVITIANPPAVTVAASAPAILCYNGNTTITASGSGGAAPYQYQLNTNPFQVGNSFNPISAGTYTITVQDANNCTASTVITITQPPVLVIDSIINTIPSCVPGNDAVITVFASGGTPPLQYSNGGPFQNANIFLNVGAGAYTITVMDANNCSVSSAILIAPPNAPQWQNLSVVEPLCFAGNTGSISISAIGANPPLNYTLMPGNVNNATGLFPNLIAGSYTVTVADANNCSISTVILINQPTQLNVTAAAPAILCNNGTTTIIASGTGGTAPYQFQLNTNPFQVGNSFSLISAGTYTITAQDANNCTASTVITIANPPAVTVAASAPAILCYNGTTTITASGSGGAAPYQYQLNTNPFQVGNSFNPISAGTYTITVQDANNCTASTVITITQPPVLVIDSIINTIPSCVPGNDAVITVFASGGTPPLQYSNGGPFQNSNIFLNVGAGAYTITVMDANNCSVSSAILIAPPNAPQWQNLSVVEPLCFAGNTGSISISAIGANPPLNYTLMPGNVNNATGLFPNLIAGSYTVTVADANNCSISTVILINQPTQLNVTAAAPAILCNNGTTTIIASGTGGTAPYQFQLNTNPFQVGNSFSLISAGTYTITAQDANNCTASTVITIANPPAVTVAASAPAILCYNGNTTITASGSGGAAPYQYQLNTNPFQVGNSFNPISAGTYTITVQDANNCTASTVITITQPPVLVIDSIINTIPSCVPGNDAVITVFASGGTPPLQYSNGGPFQNANIFLNVGAGAYTITVMDANNCSVSSAILIAPPNAPQWQNLSVVEPLCFAGNTGSISISAIGANPPLNYTLMPGNVNNATGLFPNLIAGSYTVTVADANNCSISTVILINQPTQLNVTAAAPAILCNNGTTTIIASGTGGTAPYQFQLNTNPFQVGNSFSLISAGTYTITAQDANNCTASTVITIANPPAVTVAASAPAILCYNGNTTITASGSGGAAPYQYQLNTNPFQVGNSFNPISAGTYTITVQDANNCTASTVITITQPPVLVIDSIINTIPSCVPGNDAVITVFASGGTPPLQYSNGGPFQNANIFLNVGAGAYTITVMDANNCSVSSAILIAPPNAPNITSLTSTSPSCIPGNDGSITVNANGNNPPFEYSIGGIFQISNVFNNLSIGNYTITVKDMMGCTSTSIVSLAPLNNPVIDSLNIIPASCVPGCDGEVTIYSTPTIGMSYSIDNGLTFVPTSNFTNLCLGNYTIVVKDANGCTVTSIFSITNPFGPIFSSATNTPILCYNDSNAQITVLAYSPNGGITYSINPNIGIQNPSGVFNNLPAGTYTITATDSWGCAAQTIVTIIQPTLLISNIVNITNVLITSTSTGSIVANANGGTPVYTYTLLPNIGNQNPAGTFNNLPAGSYTITVTDANGCISTTVAIITEPNPMLWTSVIPNNNLCFNDSSASIVVSAIGGLGPISYSINPNIGNQNPSGTFNNLIAGTYTLTATDSVQNFIDTIITIIQPTEISVSSIVKTIPSCVPGNDATILVSAIGGTGIITYSILPTAGNVPNNTGLFIGLTTGNYTLTFTDINNCFKDTIVTIDAPFTPTITIQNSTNVLCFGENNGQLVSLATSGNGNISSYSISPNIGNQLPAGTFNNLTVGNYTITATDIKGCTTTSSNTITEPSLLIIDSLNNANLTCNGANDGEININASGGTLNYNYSIDNGTTFFPTNQFNNLSAGIYTVIVKDANDCSTSQTAIITEPNPIIINPISTTDITCFGINNGAIVLSANGGTTPYNYILNPGNISNSTGNFANLFAGNYTVTVVDFNNCSLSTTYTLNEPSQILFTNIVTTNVTCFGDNSGAMEVIANGGTGTINYTINPLIGTQTSPGNFINLFAGNYTISAIDANNCSVTTIVVIGQNPEIIISNVRYVSPTCWGESNGQIDVTANGGVGTLIYQINGGSSQSTGLFTNLASGYFTISIIDGLNCRKDSILFLSQPDKLSFSNIESEPVTCHNSNDGKISATGTGGNGNYTYYLRPGLHINKHGSFSGLRLGTYTLTIIDTLGCEFDTLVFVSPPLDPLRSTMTKKDIGCFGYGNEGWAEVLVEGGEPPYTYLWTTNPAQTTPKADSIYFGKYFVNIIDALGCEIQDTVYIEPGPCCEEVFIPTAFSPNGDQINDVFQLITAAGLELHQFEIFNRWGQKVWYTNNYYDIWDGTFRGEPCPVETYHYVFHYKCLTDGKIYIKKGDVTLIR
jgi:gliding motility-associated-like protein